MSMRAVSRWPGEPVVTKTVLYALLACLPMSATAAGIRMTAEQVERMGVVAMPLEAMQAQGGMRLPAQVVIPPAQVEVVTAPLPALVVGVNVAYGDTVRKGQVLARLQGPAMLEARRDHAQAEAQAALAAENLRRDEALFAEGIIARSRLAATLAAGRQAQALLAEKRELLRQSGMAVAGGSPAGSGELRAAFDGVVLEAAAQPGLRVDAMTPLFKLGRIAPLWLEMQASAQQASGVAAGDAVSVPGCARPGRVVRVAPHMQASSQSLLIRAELPDPAGCVKPFQFVQARVSAGKARPADTWQVPPAALVRHQGGTWVFVATAGGFEPTPVKILDESAETASVSATLSAGSHIAVKGMAAIKAAWLGLGAGEE